MENCPLSGKPCPHQKLIHITEVDNNTATSSKDLCVFCGLQHLQTIDPTFAETKSNLYDTLQALVKGKVTPQQEPVVDEKGCPNCGATMYEINLKGRLGCERCYEFYKEELKPTIYEVQGGSLQHKGKVPKRENIEDLELKLKNAIAKEDYETAKELHEKIKSLKSGK